MGLGIPELVVILFIIILIFGANRLPEIGRGLGKGIRNFKDATNDGAQATTDAVLSIVTAESGYRLTRRVTRSRSRYSSSGIAYFRETP